MLSSNRPPIASGVTPATWVFTALWAAAAGVTAVVRRFTFGIGLSLGADVFAAVTQSLVLWTRVRWAWEWGVATAISLVLFNRLSLFAFPFFRDGDLALRYSTAIAISVAAAVPQWFVLWRHVPRHWWWLAARPLDWVVSNRAFALLMTTSMYSPGSDVGEWLPRAALGGAVGAVVDGFVLAVLVPAQQSREPMSRATRSGHSKRRPRRAVR